MSKSIEFKMDEKLMPLGIKREICTFGLSILLSVRILFFTKYEF